MAVRQAGAAAAAVLAAMLLSMCVHAAPTAAHVDNEADAGWAQRSARCVFGMGMCVGMVFVLTADGAPAAPSRATR